MILVFISCESKSDAEKLANHLIDNKLAACVSVFPVGSYYFWEEKKVVADEYELIVKTTKEKLSDVEKSAEEVLSYDIPQIISIDSKASLKYTKWLEDAIK